jgi:hypothetical protein
MTLKSDSILNSLSRNRFTNRYDCTITLALEYNFFDTFPFLVPDSGSRNERRLFIVEE